MTHHTTPQGYKVILADDHYATTHTAAYKTGLKVRGMPLWFDDPEMEARVRSESPTAIKMASHEAASMLKAACEDERIARVMAHAAHESVRASLGRATTAPRDASTALWSARLQGVGSDALGRLKQASEALKEVRRG